MHRYYSLPLFHPPPRNRALLTPRFPPPTPNRKTKPMSMYELILIDYETNSESEQRGFDDPDNRPDHIYTPEPEETIPN